MLVRAGLPRVRAGESRAGVISDGDYVRTFLSTIGGPVVLAGHSYGGSVITNASAGAPDVRALAYIAAYAPDEGETLAAAGALDGASNDLAGHLLVRPYPGMPDGDGDAYSLDRARTAGVKSSYFHAALVGLALAVGAGGCSCRSTRSDRIWTGSATRPAPAGARTWSATPSRPASKRPPLPAKGCPSPARRNRPPAG